MTVCQQRGAQRSKSLAFDSIPRPEGLRLTGTVLWEGVVYSAAEALLLSVLPTLIAGQVLTASGWTQSWIGAVFSGLVALVASLLVIVAHHLGYREFRGPLVAGAALTCGILSVAYLLAMNPLAAVGGHIIMHSAAVFKGVELPPHQASESYAAGQMEPAG